MGAEKVAQALSLKPFSWELPAGCGTTAQNLQDPVATVSVKSTSSVLGTGRPKACSRLGSPHSELQDAEPRQPKATLPPRLLLPRHRLPSERAAQECTPAPVLGQRRDKACATPASERPAPKALRHRAATTLRGCLVCLLTSPSSRHTVPLLFNFAEHPVPTPC